jgi:prepilin-type processing-associated H-X9-DG protein
MGQGKQTGHARYRKFANMAMVTDGLSNTVAIAERYRACNRADGSAGRVTWHAPNSGAGDPVFAWNLNPLTGIPAGNTSPVELPQFAPFMAACRATTTQSYHLGGNNITLADGSVRTVTREVSQTTWQRAVVLDDGDVLGADW